MRVDRTAEADTEAAGRPEAEHRPPPDTPGSTEVPSRAGSRAGAAAANDAGRRPAGETPPGGIDEDDGQPVPDAEEDPPRPRARPAGRDDVATPREDPAPVEDAPADPGPRTEPRGERATGEVAAPETAVREAEPPAGAEHTLAEAEADGGEAPEVRHAPHPERIAWDPDRAELHQQIVDELYAAAADVPDEGQAIVAGGPGAAARSLLTGNAGIDRSKYLVISPADIRESLARRGMASPVDGTAATERPSLAHEESAQIARSLANRAYADRKNVIWDATTSSPASVTRRLQELRESGYRNVEGVFVRVPVGADAGRAQGRRRDDAGPPADVADPMWGGVFEDLKARFDMWRLYGDSLDGRGLLLLESSGERDDDE